jgi:hypothetical protein
LQVRDSVVTTLKLVPMKLAACMAASAMPITGRAPARAPRTGQGRRSRHHVAVDAFALADQDLVQDAGTLSASS